MAVLIFDTETTGLPLWRDPSDHPDQPHVVDLACDLCADDGSVIESYDAIINNPGVVIPDEVTELHGISTAYAQAVGVAPAVALDRFFDMVGRAETIAGHNVSFDIRMMRIMAAKVRGAKWDNELPTFCTMRRSTEHCRILSEKSRNSEDFKWPKLAEAMKHFFGEDHADAHRARPDTDAARRIYFHLRSLEQ